MRYYAGTRCIGFALFCFSHFSIDIEVSQIQLVQLLNLNSGTTEQFLARHIDPFPIWGGEQNTPMFRSAMSAIIIENQFRIMKTKERIDEVVHGL